LTQRENTMNEETKLKLAENVQALKSGQIPLLTARQTLQALLKDFDISLRIYKDEMAKIETIHFINFSAK